MTGWRLEAKEPRERGARTTLQLEESLCMMRRPHPPWPVRFSFFALEKTSRHDLPSNALLSPRQLSTTLQPRCSPPCPELPYVFFPR